MVQPNFDTLYSSAWLDLSKGPVIVSVPDTHGRYYLLPMLDMWTDVSRPRMAHHRNAGRRLCRDAARVERLAACGRRAHRRAHALCLDHRPHQDRRANRLRRSQQAPGRAKITPLSSWGKTPEPTVGTVDPAIDMKTSPKTTVDTMPARQILRYAAEILKTQPPHITDEPILAQMRRIGIERGKASTPTRSTRRSRPDWRPRPRTPKS